MVEEQEVGKNCDSGHGPHFSNRDKTLTLSIPHTHQYDKGEEMDCLGPYMSALCLCPCCRKGDTDTRHGTPFLTQLSVWTGEGGSRVQYVLKN